MTYSRFSQGIPNLTDELSVDRDYFTIIAGTTIFSRVLSGIYF
jgi:hypothetical protein